MFNPPSNDAKESASLTRSLREALERIARRHHREMHHAPEHRWWKFEHCPAEECREAREALRSSLGENQKRGNECIT